MVAQKSLISWFSFKYKKKTHKIKALDVARSFIFTFKVR